MATKIDKKNKAIKDTVAKGGIWCTLSMIFTIITSVSLGVIGISPFLSGAFGVFLFLVFCCVVVIVTIVSLGTIWISDPVRNATGKFWAFIGKTLESPKLIYDGLKPHIVWVSILLVCLASSGFIVNLIKFIKTNGANKGRFIVSCVFFGLALVNLIIALVIFYTVEIH